MKAKARLDLESASLALAVRVTLEEVQRMSDFELMERTRALLEPAVKAGTAHPHYAVELAEVQRWLAAHENDPPDADSRKARVSP